MRTGPPCSADQTQHAETRPAQQAQQAQRGHALASSRVSCSRWAALSRACWPGGPSDTPRAEQAQQAQGRRALASSRVSCSCWVTLSRWGHTRESSTLSDLASSRSSSRRCSCRARASARCACCSQRMQPTACTAPPSAATSKCGCGARPSACCARCTAAVAPAPCAICRRVLQGRTAPPWLWPPAGALQTWPGRPATCAWMPPAPRPGPAGQDTEITSVQPAWPVSLLQASVLSQPAAAQTAKSRTGYDCAWMPAAPRPGPAHRAGPTHLRPSIVEASRPQPCSIEPWPISKHGRVHSLTCCSWGRSS